MGPIGGGKSAACSVKIGKIGVEQRPGPDGVRRSRFVAIRNSYRQLRDTTIKTFHQWFPPHIMGEWRPSEDRYIIKALRAADNEPNAEIEVLFRALDRPDQVGNLLSLELTGGWVNEAREVPWTIIEALQGRVGRYPAMRDGGATWSGILMDTNPPDADSKWFRFFEEEDHSEAIAALSRVIPGMTKDRFSRIFKQPTGLSPNAENVPNLPAGYYQRAAVGKSAEWVKVYIEGEYGFTVDGMPVFPEYSDELHCPSDPKKQPITDPKLPVYRSWDFGLTPACVFSQLTTSGQWVVVDELVSDSMGIDRFSDEVLEHSARHFPGTEFIDIGDPAGSQRAQTDERTCFQILWSKGIEIEPGLQDPTIRQECVRKPLRTLFGGRPQFVLHPRCKTLRKGFMGGYAFRRLQTSGERYTSVPDKNRFSHCFPAGVMVSTPSGSVPIEALSIGDVVCAPVGDRPVTAVMSSLAYDFVDLDLVNGMSVRCTTDHKIASRGGFFIADELQYGDSIIVERGASSLLRNAAPERARCAIPHSLSTDILRREPAAAIARKSSVSEPSPVRVYDLTVDGAHCFYANGILVSNCHDALQYAATRLFAAGLVAPRSRHNDDDEPALFNHTRSGITGY